MLQSPEIVLVFIPIKHNILHAWPCKKLLECTFHRNQIIYPLYNKVNLFTEQYQQSCSVSKLSIFLCKKKCPFSTFFTLNQRIIIIPNQV